MLSSPTHMKDSYQFETRVSSYRSWISRPYVDQTLNLWVSLMEQSRAYMEIWAKTSVPRHFRFSPANCTIFFNWLINRQREVCSHDANELQVRFWRCELLIRTRSAPQTTLMFLKYVFAPKGGTISPSHSVSLRVSSHTTQSAMISQNSQPSTRECWRRFARAFSFHDALALIVRIDFFASSNFFFPPTSDTSSREKNLTFPYA